MRKSILLAMSLTFLGAGLGDAALAKPSKDALAKAFSVLERGTKAGDFAARAAAVAGLGNAPKKAALPLILDALKDPQWNVRRAAIEALRDQKDKRWETELGLAACDAMVEESEVFDILSVLKTDAAVGLIMGNLGKKECARPERYVARFTAAETPMMLAAFTAASKAKSSVVRDMFGTALPDLRLPDALPLYKAGFTKYPVELQLKMIKRFGDEKTEGDLSFVASALKSKDTSVHFPAAELLGLRGKADGRAILVAAIGSGDESLRFRALKALEPIAGAAEFELMKPIIKERETPYETLLQAYRIYVKSKSNKLGSYLEGELDNTDAPQRAAAVYFLGDVLGREAVPHLHRLINAGAEIVRKSAISAIGRLGQRESIPVLRDALARETSREWQVALLESLAAIKDAEIIPVVRFYISDGDATVKLAALKALAAVPDKSSLPDLELAARDRTKEVRELALVTMVDQDPEARFEQFDKALEWIDVYTFNRLVRKHRDLMRRHVTAALAHQRDDIRSAAFRALDQLSPSAQFEILTKLVTDSKRPTQRMAALNALVKSQQRQATDLLVSLSSGGDELLRVAAIAHLGRLGYKGAEANLLGWLDDPNERIRVAAASAVLKL